MGTHFVHNNSATALSGRMFWDTPIEHIHNHEHRHFIVERVMRYGSKKDWDLIKQWYGYEGLRSIVLEIRDLDAISVSFLCVVLDLKPEDFKCYIEKQSRQSFWDY